MPSDSPVRSSPSSATPRPSQEADAEVTLSVRKWDRVGSWLSALCALHCLVTPFITLSLPFWVYTLHYSPVHLAIALFVIPIGIFSFWQGYQRHGKKGVVMMGALGLSLMMVGLISPSSREQMRWNDMMTLAGSFLLIGAHGLNRWFLQRR
jgi:hypothetical protein